MNKKTIVIGIAIVLGIVLIANKNSKANSTDEPVIDNRPQDVKDMNAMINYLSLWKGNPLQPFNDPNLVNLWDNHLETPTSFENGPMKWYNPTDKFTSGKTWYEVKQEFFIKTAKLYKPEYSQKSYSISDFDWTYFNLTWANQNPFVNVEIPLSLESQLAIDDDGVIQNTNTTVYEVGNVGSQIAEIGFQFINLFR